MVNAITKFLKTARKRAAATVLTLSILSAGSIALVQPALTHSTVSAASCDKVNIIYCGLDQRSLTTEIDSFKASYQNGSNNGHNDLKAVYQWAGATDAMVKGMNTSNTKAGVMDNHGNITVGGKKVGTNAKMAARFLDSSWTGVVHVEGDVYARTVTPTSTDHSSYKVIVHFHNNGVADFPVAVTCGNAIKFPPVTPPKPQISCDSLSFSILNKTDRSYQFTAKASAKNTTITSYDFHFGDGKTASVKTANSTATTKHSYALDDHSYSAYVAVNSTAKNNVTSAKCHVTVKTPAKPKASLTCVSLVPSIVADQANTYKFVAKASANNTTITSYVFDFGDGKTQTVNTSATSVTSQAHTFAQAGKKYTIKVSVSSKDVKNVTSAKCQTTVTTPKTPQSPQLLCQNLSFVAVDGQANTYKFTANADVANTTITSYDFDFGDGKTQSVPTNQNSTVVTHAYADGSKSYTATVSVSSKDVKNVTSPTCKVTIPQQTHVLAATTTLPNTGAGNVIGFFGATTIAGALIHRLLIRRRVA